MTNQLKKTIEDHLKRDGFRMSKKISSGTLFTPPTYDSRIVYSIEELQKLTSEGFCSNEDAGRFLFNAFLLS